MELNKLVVTDRNEVNMADKEELARVKRKIVDVDKQLKNKQMYVNFEMVISYNKLYNLYII